jgi:hypothetical protein
MDISELKAWLLREAREREEKALQAHKAAVEARYQLETLLRELDTTRLPMTRGRGGKTT